MLKHQVNIIRYQNTILTKKEVLLLLIKKISKQTNTIAQNRNSRSSTQEEYKIAAASSLYKGATSTKSFELNRPAYITRSTTVEDHTEAVLHSTLPSHLRIQ